MDNITRKYDLSKVSPQRAEEIKAQLEEVINNITKGVNTRIHDRLKTTEKNANKKCADIVQEIEKKVNEYLNVYGLNVKAEIKLQMILNYDKM